MSIFWVTGRKFEEDHSRAIRYVDQKLMDKYILSSNFPKDGKVRTEYCDKCISWHIVRTE